MPILRVIWMSLIICLAIYGAVLWQFAAAWEKTEPRSIEQLLANPLVLALALVALMSFVMAFVIPKLMMRGRAVTAATIRTRSVVQWALIEAVAIYGLVGSIVVQDPRIFVALGSVSLLGFLLTFPSAERTLNPV